MNAIVLEPALYRLERVREVVGYVKAHWPEIAVVAPVKPGMDATELLLAGVDAVQVSSDAGSISAIHTASIDSRSMPVVAELSSPQPGDVTKAIVAGASSVMLRHADPVLEGLRTAMARIGAGSISELQSTIQLMRVTSPSI